MTDFDPPSPSFDLPKSSAERWGGRAIEDIEIDDPGTTLIINPDDLEFELSRIAAVMARYNELYADAVESFGLAKAEVERVESLMFLTFREEMYAKARTEYKMLLAAEPKNKSTLKLPTDTTINAAVKSCDEYQSARAALVLAEAEQIRLKGRVEAARRKCDALNAVNNKRNAEARAHASLPANYR
jgi:hypothetical protein